ncbi:MULTISPECIES: hypothetical protein [Streptomyces]|uniref:Uncharacterized protein n=3 Tax=Streptomyces TaxID=1883 RepID=A0A117Q965_STRCK|nr:MULTISPECIES: hypothetical protein [Streptomyces]KUN15508.1 hypothetical protein AQJ11_42990 [Streptomyces corchorusii]GHA54551.1 hypothetical protein GCM10010345_68990 [Streptomyces canarius]
MPRSTDRQADPAAATASLAAEAALLEGRLRLLREAIDTVDARIDVVSEALRQLQHAVALPAEGRKHPGETDGARLDHSTRPDRP